MTGQYILNDQNEPVPCEDLMEWGTWLRENFEKRRIAWTEDKKYHVSTVFLGLDHGFGYGDPILFETMVFGNEDNGSISHMELDMERYATYAEAVEGHARMVQRWLKVPWYRRLIRYFTK